MATEKSIYDSSTRTQKKSTVMANPDKQRQRTLVALAVIVVTVAAAALLLTGSWRKLLPARTTDAGLEASASTIALDAEQFDDGKAHYFQYTVNDDLAIRFFVLKSSDGVIRAAFDACDVCWRENKGYAQDGDHMVCRNCGRRFASVQINEVKGGCNPAPLKRRLVDGRVLIERRAILAGAPFFRFAKERGA